MVHRVAKLPSDPRRTARWKRLRLETIERDGYQCRECGRGVWPFGGGAEVDHIKRIEDGGDPWAPSNLQTLCSGCHSAKTAIENRGRPPSDAEAAWRELVRELR